ncbi:MAG: tetratricopeptide repeat protein [Bacteroidales bacterium]|nr:tetratricopeptide repeat protein [Bacteroidales bacterium]
MKKVFFQVVFIILLFSCGFGLIAQNKKDSLLKALLYAEVRSEIYNQLAELVLEDSTALSEYYARKALKASIEEEKTSQKAIAIFNLAEVQCLNYHFDSAIYYYQKCLILFKTLGDDYNTSYTLNNLGWILNEYGEYAQAINYYIESLNYIDQEQFSDDYAHLLINIGNAHQKLGNYFTAINYFRKSALISINNKDNFALPIAYNGIALAYKYLGNFDSAISYYKQNLEIDKKYGTPYNQAIDYGNIGSLYYDWKMFKESFNFHRDALILYKQHGSINDLSIAYNNLGNVYLGFNNSDSAIYYFRKALIIDLETGKEHNIAIRYNNLGDACSAMGENDSAMFYYMKSLDINLKNNARYSIAMNYKNMGMLSQELNDTKNAEQYLLKSLQIADSIQSRNLMIQIHQSLSEIYSFRGSFQKALDHHIMFSSLKDSLFRQQSQNSLADLETRYQLEKKEQKIALLNNDNKYQKLKVKDYKTRMYFLVFGLIIISILSMFLFHQYNEKNKAYKKLVEKNQDFIQHEKMLREQLSRKKADTKNKSKPENHPKLIREILNLFEKEKPYLNQDINLKEIADKLETNPKYISQAINENFNKNFNSFINEYRIRLAMKYLVNGVKDKYSIEGISEKVGFHSKSAFNIAFRKMTGVTPSFYIKSIKKDEKKESDK